MILLCLSRSMHTVSPWFINLRALRTQPLFHSLAHTSWGKRKFAFLWKTNTQFIVLLFSFLWPFFGFAFNKVEVKPRGRWSSLEQATENFQTKIHLHVWGTCMIPSCRLSEWTTQFFYKWILKFIHLILGCRLFSISFSSLSRKVCSCLIQ